MKASSKDRRATSVADRVRRRVDSSADRLWRFSDFKDLPPGAVAASLSRLHRDGVLSKLRRGVYYKPRPTVVGPSRPTSEALIAKVARDPLVPSGLTAAAYLGFTTQTPATLEYATTANNAPTGLVRAIVHTRRSGRRRSLSVREGAIMEFLRDRGAASDLSPAETVQHLEELVREGDTYRKLALAADGEPPRVRAMLGSLGEEVGAPDLLLRKLHRSLNPLSRFDFGILRALSAAPSWYAR